VLPFEREAETTAERFGWAGVGIEFGVIVVAFFLGGRALDGKLGSEPWGTAGGTLLGVALGVWLLIRRALRAEREDAAKREGRRG
jgi:F0F1-type ATP synthase assembly protein I